jgi:hypothetical protein
MGRLTTAAVSALAILMVTAESWQIAAHLRVFVLVLLGSGAIVSTSVYVLQGQGLLSVHRSLRLTEQVVVARVSISCFVLMGVLATYGLLVLVATVLGGMLLDPRFVSVWTEGAGRSVDWTTYAAQASFAAALAVLVGALGASFEGQSYVKHVAYVDEET